MSDSAPAQPAAPDPKVTASAQGAANVDTAIAQQFMNMGGQSGPYGTVSYTPNGNTTTVGTGDDQRTIQQYNQTTTLAPEQQKLLDLQNQAAQTFGTTANTQLDSVKHLLEKPLDYSSLGPAPALDEEQRSRTLESMLARAQPQADRDRAALETRLATQGIKYGDDAYKQAFGTFNTGQTDFRLGADQAAGNEMRQDFQSSANARDRAAAEMNQQRQMPLNELLAMVTGSQVNIPGAPPAPQTQLQAPDIMGANYASYNGAMQGYGAQVANTNSKNAGTAGAVGALAMVAMAF